MDTSDWQTHCFGRYLVDLPSGTKINTRFEIDGDEIEKLEKMANELPKLAIAREQELRSSPHETARSMFVRRLELHEPSVGFLSWYRPYHKDAYQIEAYLSAGEVGPVYFYGGLVSLSRENFSVDFISSLSESLVPLAPGEIPQGQGFCIDGANIVGNEQRSESFRVHMTSPEYPGMTFELFATTQGEVEKPLLDRLKAQGVGALLTRFAGIKVLRKGDRPVGELPAQEFLSVADDNGQRKYAFTWQAPGKADSVAWPQINAHMGVLDAEPDAPASKPAFQSDAQALALWDAIINSIRPRPGTQDAPPPRPPERPLGYSQEKAEANRRTLEDFLASAAHPTPRG